MNLCDLGLGKDFLYMKPKEKSIKEQIGNLNFIKIMCSLKDTSKMKR